MGAEEIVKDVADRVRAIVTEAEERAAEIVREAEADAKRIRERAESEGAERLAEVRQALDDLQGKLSGGQARAAAPSSNGAKAEVEPGPVVVPEPEPPPETDPGPAPVPEPAPDPAPEPEPATIPEPTPPPDEGTPPSADEPAAGRSDDVAAARLVAMNLALDGASKEAIVEQLERDYELDDPGAVADDVLALAGPK
jgi:vacuolar-type H+-ATPase subunit H